MDVKTVVVFPVLFVLVNLVPCQGIFVIKPENKAGFVGSRLTIKVTVSGYDSSEHFEWYDNTNVTVVNALGKRIFSTHYLNQPVPANFEINYVEQLGQIDLTIKSLQKVNAGTYVFRQDASQINHRVEVVALDPLQCYPSPGTTEQFEHAEVFLDGYMGFSGAIGPRMEWSSSETGPVDTYVLPLNEEEIGKVVKYRANVTAKPHLAGVKFFNRVHFVFSILNDSFEFHPPNFSAECQTDFDVFYTPRNFIISPDPDESPDGLMMVVGDAFNCSASGHPEFTIMWMKGEGEQYVTQPWLGITDKMVGHNNSYSCVAQQDYGGTFIQESRQITFSARHAESAEAQSGMAPWAIALATCIPIAAVGTAAGVGGYMYYKRRKKTKGDADNKGGTKTKDVNKLQKPVALGRHRFPPGFDPENRNSRPMSGEMQGRPPPTVETGAEKGKQRQSHINKMVPEEPSNGFTPGQVSRHSSTGNVSRHSVGYETADVSGAMGRRQSQPEEKALLSASKQNLQEQGKQGEVRRSRQNLLQNVPLSQVDPTARRSQQNLAGTDMQRKSQQNLASQMPQAPLRRSQQNLAGTELQPALRKSQHNLTDQHPQAPLRKSQQNLADPSLRSNQQNIAGGSMPQAPLRKSRQNLATDAEGQELRKSQQNLITDDQMKVALRRSQQNLAGQALRLSQQNIVDPELKVAQRKSQMELGSGVDAGQQDAQYKEMLRKSQENLFKMSQQAMKVKEPTSGSM